MRRARTLAALALAAGAAVTAPASAAAAPSAPVASSPLAANGFQSPSCTSPELSLQLSTGERTNCSISGVAVAAVPLSNYAIDVNIPSLLDASATEDVDAIVQDLLVTPVWTALVWLVHVVLVALEWCYSLELLAPTTLARASTVLGGAKRVFTDPWLGLALAVAAIGFAWQGLVRRRVLDTLGRAALLALMVTAGLWIIADPTGTVGAVGGLADRAALATVAASATGDPTQPVATVDAAFGSVFDAAIDGPWCYLEFGDVAWCNSPAGLDPRLRAVADQLAQIYRAAATCHGPAPGLVQCAPQGSAAQRESAGSAAALTLARTNGALFLALPAGSVGRTLLSGPSPSLYGALCGSNTATACTAPTAPQAEFRTASGTWPRVGGLLLIVAGTLGMLLLLGFIALRLLGAALATLVYLLLAPLAVLAPALGDSGRDTFRLWLTRLVGSLLSKLVYSVALGVVLFVVALLESLDNLGWWTQWLLVSVFWWIAFEHRHRLLSLVLHERGEPARQSPLANRLWLARRTAGASAAAVTLPGRAVVRAGSGAAEISARWRDFSQERGAGGPAPPPSRFERVARGEIRARARAELRAQTDRLAVAERGTPAGSPPAAAGGLAARDERLRLAITRARAAGDRRRVISLERRRERVAVLRAASEQRSEPGPARAALARLVPSAAARMLETRTRRRTLDRAARAAGQPLRSRDRAAKLAGLAGVSTAEYLRRAPGEQRALRLEIERQLARRQVLLRDAEPAPLQLLRTIVARDAQRSEPAPERRPLTSRQRQFGSRPR